nr:MAG TPA: hypothetical protein [Caudoviricetes sp.]
MHRNTVLFYIIIQIYCSVNTLFSVYLYFCIVI